MKSKANVERQLSERFLRLAGLGMLDLCCVACCPGTALDRLFQCPLACSATALQGNFVVHLLVVSRCRS